MGHTLPTITHGFQRFLAHLSLFKRALRKSDQIALTDLINEANQHLPAAGYAANVVPGVTFLLSMLLEKHKQLVRHEAEFENLRADFRKEFRNLQQELALQLSKLRTETILLSQRSHETDPD